ncbi:MAG: transglycosylase SLT domain-containing protein [Pseudacidovorax sp.]|nr:transglycosylase SLT domain-containing protein [Pseudacidovorax sp.]
MGRVVLCIVLLMLCALFGVSCTAAAQTIPRDAERYQLTLKREAQRTWGLDAPVATFAAQVHQESRWRADARSPVGAQGLAQFMPSTASWIGGVYASHLPIVTKAERERTPPPLAHYLTNLARLCAKAA